MRNHKFKLNLTKNMLFKQSIIKRLLYLMVSNMLTWFKEIISFSWVPELTTRTNSQAKKKNKEFKQFLKYRNKKLSLKSQEKNYLHSRQNNKQLLPYPKKRRLYKFGNQMWYFRNSKNQNLHLRSLSSSQVNSTLLTSSQFFPLNKEWFQLSRRFLKYLKTNKKNSNTLTSLNQNLCWPSKIAPNNSFNHRLSSRKLQMFNWILTILLPTIRQFNINIRFI